MSATYYLAIVLCKFLILGSYDYHGWMSCMVVSVMEELHGCQCDRGAAWLSV